MTQPEDAAKRAIQYRGQLGGMVAQGMFASKGTARRTLGVEGLPPLADPLQSWMGRMTLGLAGTHPKLPNSALGEPSKRPWWKFWA